jgi:hypothetical protein
MFEIVLPGQSGTSGCGAQWNMSFDSTPVEHVVPQFPGHSETDISLLLLAAHAYTFFWPMTFHTRWRSYV